MPDQRRHATDSRPDVLLVQLAARGDEAAFAALFHRHKDYVARVASRYTRDHETALDVVQETFGYLARKLPSLVLTAKLTTYLFPIAKNLALSAKRKDRVRLRLATGEGSAGDPATPEPPSRPDPTCLEAMIESLPEYHREVLLMRFADDMSLLEIAAALDIPEGTVKSRLHLAIKALQQDPKIREMFPDVSRPPV